MRYILNPVFIFGVLLSTSTLAQKKDTTFIYLDSTMTPAAKAAACCVEKIFAKDGLWNILVAYRYKPYRIMTGSYKDKELQEAEGLYEYYLRDTVIMRGYYHNGAQSGIWKKWTTDGLVTDSVYFDNGNAVGIAKFVYHDNRHLWRYSLETDDKQKITKVYDTADVLLSEGHFQEKDGEMFLYYPNGKVKTHSVYKNNQRMMYDLFDEDGKKYTEQEYNEMPRKKNE